MVNGDFGKTDDKMETCQKEEIREDEGPILNNNLPVSDNGEIYPDEDTPCQRSTQSQDRACMECDTESVKKLMPCLHVQCVSCLEKNVIRETTASKASFYACRTCGHKISKTSSSFDIGESLKDVPLFRTNVEVCSNGNGDIPSSNNNKDVNVEGKDPSCSDTNKVSEEAQSKKDYLSSLLDELHSKTKKHHQSASCVDRVKQYLTKLKDEIQNDIIQRSQYLISLIENRQNSLIRELDDVFKTNIQNYEKMKSTFMDDLKQFEFVDEFTTDLITKGTSDEILSHHDDASNACLRQIHQVPDATVDVLSLKLEIPGKGKEQSALEKLFGSLTEGTVLSGTAELVATFNVDMKWPTSIAVSPSKEIVITGKTGTFETPGNAFFFDSRGRFHSKVKFDAQHVPLDVQPAGDGTVWMSNNSGEILNISAAGRTLRAVPNVFRGSGQISVLTDGSLAVASSVENKVHILDEIGQFKHAISMPDEARYTGNADDFDPDSKNGVKLNAITTSSMDDLIIGDSKGGRVIVMDIEGNVKFTYPENGFKPSEESSPLLKCPSSVCCDPFDNILVADFTNDSVHLFSKSGQFLGNLLTKDNGISCPNCMALDHEGKLYIGQYGGDILVYRYMSCSKRA